MGAECLYLQYKHDEAMLHFGNYYVCMCMYNFITFTLANYLNPLNSQRVVWRKGLIWNIHVQ